MSRDFLVGYPTDDTRLLTKAVQEGVERVYREGFCYSKAEVLLLDLSQPNEIIGDLFAAAQSVASEMDQVFRAPSAGSRTWQSCLAVSAGIDSSG